VFYKKYQCKRSSAIADKPSDASICVSICCTVSVQKHKLLLKLSTAWAEHNEWVLSYATTHKEITGANTASARSHQSDWHWRFIGVDLSITHNTSQNHGANSSLGHF